VTVVPPILVLILAGGKSARLHALGRMRTASALPFGGKYRVIDFTLSNCVHSGLMRIGVLTQYAPLSLQGHIGIGRAWDLDRRDGGIRLLQPYVRQRETNWYRGTADALVQNRNVIADAQARHILVVSGDVVYKTDFGPFIERHESRGAALSIVTGDCPDGEPERHGIVEVDADGRVRAMKDRSRGGPGPERVSTSIYLFRARELMERLADPSLGPDLVQDVIRPMIQSSLPVFADPLDGYWRDIGTIDSYYAANMDLLAPFPPLNLSDPDWLIYTPSEDRAPSLLGAESDLTSSMVAHGSRIEGTVRQCVLFPGVHVGPRAIVEESIVMHDTRILPGARVHRAILDKQVRVGEGASIGTGEAVRHREHPHDLASGLTVVGKRAEIPAGSRIGRNCMIEIGVRQSDFDREEVPSGSTVRPATAGVRVP
jgi:glucose-1-phosphate adenylyltransferase